MKMKSFLARATLCLTLASCSPGDALSPSSEFPEPGNYSVVSREGAEEKEFEKWIDASTAAKIQELVSEGHCSDDGWNIGGGSIEGHVTCWVVDPRRPFPTEISGQYSPTSLEFVLTMDIGELGPLVEEKRFQRLLDQPSG
jgi:hypothetical protein